jgi:tRNA A-37 threonylcarbamoyl transferase component Bud32
MLLELDQEQLRVLGRALEATARDMHLRLGTDPGDEGFRREATLATQLLRQIEALERRAGYRDWGIGDIESLPDDNEN